METHNLFQLDIYFYLFLETDRIFHFPFTFRKKYLFRKKGTLTWSKKRKWQESIHREEILADHKLKDSKLKLKFLCLTVCVSITIFASCPVPLRTTLKNLYKFLMLRHMWKGRKKKKKRKGRKEWKKKERKKT